MVFNFLSELLWFKLKSWKKKHKQIPYTEFMKKTDKKAKI